MTGICHYTCFILSPLLKKRVIFGWDFLFCSLIVWGLLEHWFGHFFFPIAGLSSGYHDTLSLETPISTMLQPQQSSVLLRQLSDTNAQFEPSYRLTWAGHGEASSSSREHPI